MTEPGDELEVLTDDDGVLLYGTPTALDAFVTSHGLQGLSTDVELPRLSALLRKGEALAKTASEAVEKSGLYLKLTPESAEAWKKVGLVETDTSGVSWAMLGKRGDIAGWLKVDTSAGPLLANPAMLTGAAGILGQLAGQSEMAELKAYLETIDVKIDDVLAGQKNAELSKVLGATVDINKAHDLLLTQGFIDETTWDMVQDRQATISDAQQWALLGLHDLAVKLENPRKMKVLATTFKSAAADVQTYHVVLAHSLELQDGYDAVRLSRLEQTNPELLDGQCTALRAQRKERHALIKAKHDELLGRMDAAAEKAGAKALLHHPSLRKVEDYTNRVGRAIDEFHKPLGIEAMHVPVDKTRWLDAARSLPQLKTAVVEVGGYAAKGAVVVGAAALFTAAAAAAKNEFDKGTPSA